MLEDREDLGHGTHAAHRHQADHPRDERAAAAHDQERAAVPHDPNRHHGGAPHVAPDPDLESMRGARRDRACI
jgi:hypothetical protein